jgi:hypothetical protein
MIENISSDLMESYSSQHLASAMVPEQYKNFCRATEDQLHLKEGWKATHFPHTKRCGMTQDMFPLKSYIMVLVNKVLPASYIS